MDLGNFIKSMNEFKHDKPYGKFGYDLFLKYLQKLVDESPTSSDAYSKLKNYYGLDEDNFNYIIPVNPLAIWISKILSEFELVQIYGKYNYRDKLEKAKAAISQLL